jgi:hypothetical protein
MRPYGEFPISFDLHKDGQPLYTQSTVRNEEEEQRVIELAHQNYPNTTITQHNRFDKRHDTRPAHSIPEIQALKLCTVYCDGSTTLVSLALNTLLYDNGEGESPLNNTPHVYLITDDENKASDEWYGTEDGKADDNGFPGWPAIFHYLNNHPERLTTDHK